MEILHTAYIINAKLIFEDADFEDIEKRNSYVLKTPTSTLPFLETPEGNVSESLSIETFLANKFKPDLLGRNSFERAKINQWVEFGANEIQKCLKEIIYPIFNWKELNKEMADKANKNIKQYIIILEKELNHGKNYILGDKITLADIVLFRYLRLFMMLHFPENLRNGLFPKLTKWFENIMNTPEAIEAYGRTILCKKPLKNLEQFKNEYFEEKGDKNKIMDKFWEEFDPQGYSLWWMEYQNLVSEGKKLFRMNNSKNFFLERIDEDFSDYAFGLHGVYEKEGDYKVRGIWMWRGNEIPKEIKDNEYFEYMTIKKLNIKNESDKQLIRDYWTKINKGEKVDGRTLVEFSYLH